MILVKSFSKSCRRLSRTLEQCSTKSAEWKNMQPEFVGVQTIICTEFEGLDCLNFSTTKLLVHSLVTSRLNYANGLLHNAPISVIKKLDRVQRSSARVVCRLHKYQRIFMTEVLHDLHWLPVASRIKYKLFFVTFKALRTGAPGYLSDLLVKQKIARRTRSQSIDAPDRLIVPLYSGERSAGTSYSVAAPKLWNSLPANIRSSRSLDTFKKHLKTHYFKEHFYGI